MRVLAVPSSIRAPQRRQYLTSFLVNDTVAIDAGTLAYGLARRQQARIKHIFLTHTHLDHIASLPIFLDTVYDGSGDCVTIHATAAVLDCLRRDVFNNRVWPDFIAISEQAPPYLKLHEIEPRRAVEVEGLRITPIPVNHVVECQGYVIGDGRSSVVFSSDTGPTEEIWRVAAALPDLKAVFLECTFPNDLAWLADLAKHLTPVMVEKECAKIPAGARILAVHLHSRYRAQVEQELQQVDREIEVVRFGREYPL
ncbi:MAG: 3',5'-cyclic-nucleotide phosphodiesterase [Gemmataceae bacterium]